MKITYPYLPIVTNTHYKTSREGEMESCCGPIVIFLSGMYGEGAERMREGSFEQDYSVLVVNTAFIDQSLFYDLIGHTRIHLDTDQ